MLLLLSLGSNLGEREAQIRRAADLIATRTGRLVALSSLHNYAPWGFRSEHPFINAAAVIDTALDAETILDTAEAVERELGRTAKSRVNGYHDRTIDIDLLALDDAIVETPRLSLPHPHLPRRRFVLEPLCEIAASVIHPTIGKTYADLLSDLNTLQISRATEASDELIVAMNRLLPQLSSTAPFYTTSTLTTLLVAPSTRVFIGRDEEGVIRATCTLCLVQMPTGHKAWLEDVVTDTACRGRGYARQLIARAVDEARAEGCTCLNLTSRPSREAANHLYHSLGFQQRETNVYRLDL
ncbi:MAG: 2-amino-4-hydroxy-6-hydroxymethyldihydropteridine diphosphokinase [Bacteroidaceae bacterium]|nr:2-amino-4-hydroxy-6-hydroxymethyldihydropteridine diphosphokinase [Bacteroidaceae bacterium]